MQYVIRSQAPQKRIPEEVGSTGGLPPPSRVPSCDTHLPPDEFAVTSPLQKKHAQGQHVSIRKGQLLIRVCDGSMFLYTVQSDGDNVRSCMGTWSPYIITCSYIARSCDVLRKTRSRIFWHLALRKFYTKTAKPSSGKSRMPPPCVASAVAGAQRFAQAALDPARAPQRALARE